MLYKVRRHTYIRNYPDFGYICNVVINNDLIFDNSGKIFLEALSKQCKSFESICEDIAESYIGVDFAVIESDVKEFLSYLETQGFIISGVSERDIQRKEKIYSELHKHKTESGIANYVPITKQELTSSRKFLREYFIKKPHIVSIQIEISNTCNERCIHCYIPHDHKTLHLDFDLFKKTLDSCRELGVVTILLTGGEPMMHPQFIEILKMASTYDFEIKILSNLTLLTDEIVELLKNSNCSGVQVSLYSMNPTIHDSITCIEGSFKKTTDSIRKLINAGIPVQLSCVIMKQNKDCYREVVKWGAKMGIITTIDYVLMGRCDYSTSNLDHRLDLLEVEKIIRETLEHDQNYKDRVINTDIQQVINSFKNTDNICNVCRTTIGISAKGNVYPCVGWQGFSLGNLNESSLKEIWESSPRVCSLRAIKREDFAECKDCDKKAFCSMCLVRNANENNGDYRIINKHTCNIAELNKKIVLEYKSSHYNNITS